MIARQKKTHMQWLRQGYLHTLHATNMSTIKNPTRNPNRNSCPTKRLMQESIVRLKVRLNHDEYLMQHRARFLDDAGRIRHQHDKVDEKRSVRTTSGAVLLCR